MKALFIIANAQQMRKTAAKTTGLPSDSDSGIYYLKYFTHSSNKRKDSYKGVHTALNYVALEGGRIVVCPDTGSLEKSGRVPGPNGSLTGRANVGGCSLCSTWASLTVVSMTCSPARPTSIGDTVRFGVEGIEEEGDDDDPNILSLASRYFSSRSCKVFLSLFPAEELEDDGPAGFGRFRIRTGGSNESSGGKDDPAEPSL